MLNTSRSTEQNNPQVVNSKQEIHKQYKTLTDLVQFSNHLGGKVDSLLHQQQAEFFKAYKSHLTEIKENVMKLEDKIAYQQLKIRQYQSQGTIALLLKKVSKLQSQLNTLYGSRNKIFAQLQQQKVKNQVLESQNKKLSLDVKKLMKTTTERIVKTMQMKKVNKVVKQQQDQHSVFFTTQVHQSIDKDHSPSSRKQRVQFQNKLLKSKITTLTSQHNKLLKDSVKIVTLHSQLQGFFLQCVETVKKQICFRKQVPTCHMKDFRKQDKVNILNMVLQNDDIIAMIYTKLFKTNSPQKINDRRNTDINLQHFVNYTPSKRHSELKRSKRVSSESFTLPKIKVRQKGVMTTQNTIDIN